MHACTQVTANRSICLQVNKEKSQPLFVSFSLDFVWKENRMSESVKWFCHCFCFSQNTRCLLRSAIITTLANLHHFLLMSPICTFLSSIFLMRFCFWYWGVLYELSPFRKTLNCLAGNVWFQRHKTVQNVRKVKFIIIVIIYDKSLLWNQFFYS